MAAYRISEYLLDIGTLSNYQNAQQSLARISSTHNPPLEDYRTQMLGGVIFDFDGVIVDSHPAAHGGLESFSAVPKAKMSMTRIFLLSAKARNAKRYCGIFSANSLQNKSRVTALKRTNYFRSARDELQLVQGFADFLAELDSAGLPSGVATSGSRARVEQALAAFNLRNRFRAVVTGDDVERGKPDPALFLLAAQALQIDPSRILVFEDAVAGVLAAKNAGMKCVGIAASGRELSLKQAGADLVMNDFADTTLNDLRPLFV